MKPILSRRLVVLSCLFALHIAASAQPTASSSPTWHFYFSPLGEATSAIRQALNSAKSTVLVQACSFTSAPITEALAKSSQARGQGPGYPRQEPEDPEVLLRRLPGQLRHPTKIDAAHAIARNKVMA